MKKSKEVTIYDIASALNVSPSTVSRALKKHKSIGKETIKKVEKKATQMGYRPNRVAANLRTQKTNTIGVIVPRVDRPFISTLISGIESEAKAKGYHVIFTQSHDKIKLEKENAKLLFNYRVDGIIVSLAMETNNYDHFLPFKDKDIPLVFVDRVTESLDTDLVVIDNTQSAQIATQHLIDQGCKRIAHLAGAQHRNVYLNRRKGYEKALLENGFIVEQKCIIELKQLSAEEGYQSAKTLLKQNPRPDGIFTANDTTAVSVIQCAKELGIKIPEELAVVGFNNDPICTIIDPALSTINHPAREMGEIAARQLLSHRIHSETETSNIIKLKTELIQRASSTRIEK
ncbi:LacI family DNA-binding transcriptional regulator [Reichenbachiella sp. MSK19-1]|uniref:LacI family DNA-binding transcriptional regulator n=1 Tax=Reichenbachiella sp. MSK19-1 TaxID=1897631 RepID=UPI000E6C17DB|nr:LacI family DNA-binding transcriptional regulator [Reichenbachiella sp. MSK19-1]RJE74595.1 LacI family transcriptional regulator [Reichenbachiella sp. MSK19-1]